MGNLAFWLFQRLLACRGKANVPNEGGKIHLKKMCDVQNINTPPNFCPYHPSNIKKPQLQPHLSTKYPAPPNFPIFSYLCAAFLTTLPNDVLFEGTLKRFPQIKPTHSLNHSFTRRSLFIRQSFNAGGGEGGTHDFLHYGCYRNSPLLQSKRHCPR